jgi:hypothetical protein
MKNPDEFRGRDPVEELIAAYALNAVEPHERAVVELVLAQDERYQELLVGYLEKAATLSSSHPLIMPTPDLRRRVLESIRFRVVGSGKEGDSTIPGGVAPPNRSVFLLFGILLVLLIGFGFYQQYQVGKLEGNLASTEQLVQVQQNALADAIGAQQELANDILREIGWTQEQVKLARAGLYWSALPGVQSIILDSVGPDDPSSVEGIADAMLMVTPDQMGALLIVVGLTPVEDDIIYQTWFWRKEGLPEASLDFIPDPTGYAQVFIPLHQGIAPYKAVSVTKEPLRGNLVPKGPTILTGSISTVPLP